MSKRARLGRTALAMALGLAQVPSAQAQVRVASPTPAAPAAPTQGALAATPPALRGLRARFGADAASRLMRASDPDDRLRGIERAAATHTPEGLALLVRAAGPPAPVELRTDPRALLEIVRGLAHWLDRETAREALASIIKDAHDVRTSNENRGRAPDEAERAARVLLARQEAALALAGSGSTAAIDALVAIARSGGPGQGPALRALAVHPPVAPFSLGGVALTTPATIALAADIGDLRALEFTLGALGASDPALRAAALAALGTAGDMRCIDVARAALHDPDEHVRMAAAEALVRLHAPDGDPAVEALIADDTTALVALRLAQQVRSEGVARAAAARAAASADPVLRSAAIAALGRQTTPSAVRALVTFVADPRLEGDAACALARSPSPAALGALETLASAPATRRLAARAYFVRRFVRGDRSKELDAVLDWLARSKDARDRAVGAQALVALGERPVDFAISDGDARVRRAGAMGALGHWGAGTGRRLLARAAIEPDETTRQVLALGLIDGDPEGALPTSALVERAGAGGPDAALAAAVLAQRGGEAGAEADALMQSRDPVLREHAARGLGASNSPDAVGRLARAYAWETDAGARRAIIAALGVRRDAENSALRRETLGLAASLDPDAVVRWTAERAIAGKTASVTAPRAGAREVAWVRLVPAEDTVLPRDATALLAQSGGLALPVAFDEDGYALVPGVRAGEAKLRLAPGLPSYSAPPP